MDRKIVTPTELGELQAVNRVVAIGQIALGIAVAHRSAGQPLGDASWIRLPVDLEDMDAAAKELETKGWKLVLDYMGHKNDHAGSGLQVPEHPRLIVLGYEGDALTLVENTPLEDAIAAYCEGMFLLKFAAITEHSYCNIRLWEGGERDSMINAGFIFFETYESRNVKVPMEIWRKALDRFLQAGWAFVNCRVDDEGDPAVVNVRIDYEDGTENPNEAYAHDFLYAVDWEWRHQRHGEGPERLSEIVLRSRLSLDTDKIIAMWREKDKIPRNEEWSFNIEHDDYDFNTYTLRRRKRDA